MRPSEHCQLILDRASPYVDGRLGPRSRKVIEDHLAICAQCRGEVEGWRSLSRLLADRPREPLSRDFGATVRRVATLGDRGFRFGRWWHRIGPGHVAAAAVLVVSLFGAYHLGRTHGGADMPARSARPSAFVGADDPIALRAARSVVSDLSVIDRVPKPLRRPMLQAQLRHFGLSDWAGRSRVQREPLEASTLLVANLIHDLDRALTEGVDEPDLLVLRDAARDRRLWTSSQKKPSGPDEGSLEEQRRRGVLEVVADLPAEVQGPVGVLLNLKDSLVRGRYGQAVTVSREGGLDVSDLGPFVHLSLASVFGEDGLDDLARPHLRTLQDRCPELMSVLSETVFRGRNPVVSRVPGQLEHLLRWVDGNGELRVEEEATSSGYSYRVTLERR